MSSPTERLWQRTPLIRSSALSDKTGCEVYLKIETFQTSGSFKGRGVSHFANQAVKAYLRANGLISLDTKALAVEAAKEPVDDWSIPTLISNIPEDQRPHLVIASGGNAGLAAASAAGILGVPCTIFMPDEQANIVHMFTRHGKNIEARVGGVNYNAASFSARIFADTLGERGIFIPPFDDPLVWQGNSSLLTEIHEQLPQNIKPDAIFCSIGGGGLIAGTMLGCEAVGGWQDVPVVGIETSGSACFYHSMQSNRQSAEIAASLLPEGATTSLVEASDLYLRPISDTQVKAEPISIVHLAAITSRATSLGASTPSIGAVAIALKRKGSVHCVTISDERAMSASLQFAGDHSVVTELACSATLVPAYTPHLLDHILGPQASICNGVVAQRKKVLVFVVCGGSKGSLDAMRMFDEKLRDWEEDDIWVDGTRLDPSVKRN